MGNLMLAAYSLGLGSIWIHRAKEEFEMPEYKKLLADLGIEGNWEGIGHCAVGYIDGAVRAGFSRTPVRRQTRCAVGRALLERANAHRKYYDNCLYFFALLALSGKYRIY